MLLQTLLQAKTEHKLVCIYSNNENTESFSAGYIQQVNENVVLIDSVNRQGDYDGYLVKKTDDIFLIEWDNQYTKKLTALNANKFQHKTIPYIQENILRSILHFAKSEHLIVSVQLLDSNIVDMQGYVLNINEEQLSILCIDDMGNDDGQAVCRLKDITTLSCDSEDENIISRLKNSIDLAES